MKPLRRFTDMLGMLSRGRLVERCDDELEEIIKSLEALPAEKGKASLSLTIEFTYDSGRLDIRPTVKAKLPDGQAFSGTPFWAHEGGLSVQHPSQLDMLAGPREVPAEKPDAARGAVSGKPRHSAG